MSQLNDVLLNRTWWTWNPRDEQWLSLVYHWFNIFEGAAWFVFAGLVLQRFVKNRKSRLEITYSIAFFTFAITDFREAWEQSSWLIWLKLMNLIVLVWLRRDVMRRWYPEAKVY